MTKRDGKDNLFYKGIQMAVQKVLEQAKKDNIKFITLQFTDLLGVIKEVIIPVEENI
jgi:glutamine synthetase